MYKILIFFRTAVLRKLFDIRFSCKHCNFSRVCLLVNMASKTVTRPIINLSNHNAPCLRPKILHNHCFQFLLGITVVLREIEHYGYEKFWGVNKVHYGLCDNGEFRKTDSQEQTRLGGQWIAVCIWLIKVSLFSLINNMIYY